MNFIAKPPRRFGARGAFTSVSEPVARMRHRPRSEFEFVAELGRDEVDVLPVALHPVVDEGAEGEDGEALLASPVEGEAGEPAAEAAALVAILDLGVDQRDQALAGAVGEEARELPVD